MTILMTVGLAVFAVQAWCLWRLATRLRGLARVDERLTALANTITLLTETTETCFNTIALHVESSQPTRSAAASSQRRVVRAAGTGRSVTEIAAMEELAESEVRLRLHMAHEAARRKEASHGAVRR